MFEAQNSQMLVDIYKELDKLEPSKIHSQHYLNKHSLYTYPLSLAALLLFFMILKNKRGEF